MAVKHSLWHLLAFIILAVSSAASRPVEDEGSTHNVSHSLLDKARSMRRVGDQHGEARGGAVLAADALAPLHAVAPRSHWHPHSNFNGEPSSLVHLTLGQTTALGQKALRWGSLVHKWAFPSHVSHERWRESFAGRARSTAMMQRSTKEEEEQSAKPPAPEAEMQHSDNPVWMSRFIVTLCLLSLATWCTASQLKVDVGCNDINGIPDVRGRPFCSFCCAVATILLSSVVFWFTLSVLSAEKLQYEHNHKNANATTSGAHNSNSTAQHLREIRNPGERAFEAGQGVALSVFVGIFMLCSWRYLNSVRIRLDLMAQFAMRGAIISSVAAGLMEVVGSMAVYAMRSELTSDNSKFKDGLNVWTMVLMILVGISEELAKFMALLWNTWYSEDAVLQSVVDSPSHWGCMWPTLIESPHAMMLGGLSVGLGFMVVENAGYLVEVAMMAETDDKDNASADDDSDLGLRMLRLLTIVIRVALNLHPYLTGVTAARLASLLLKQPEANSAVTITDIIWAFWFSAAVHALYDFLVVVLPGILGLFMPFLFWFLLRQHFRVWWDSFLGMRSWGDLQVRASERRNAGESGGPDDDTPHHAEISELRDENQRLREELRSLRNSLQGSGELPTKDMRQEEAESTTDIAMNGSQIVAPSNCSDEAESGTVEDTKSSASL